eukprot:13273009-Alexandrium_andersonii.AAC.1
MATANQSTPATAAPRPTQRGQGPTWQGDQERGKRRGKRRSRTAELKDCKRGRAEYGGHRGSDR